MAIIYHSLSIPPLIKLGKRPFTAQTRFRARAKDNRGFGFGTIDDIAIAVCGLEGCNGESNLASNRSTRMSSQYGHGSGDLAIDGNLEGSSPGSEDLVHTNTTPFLPLIEA